MKRVAIYIDGQNTYFALKAMSMEQISKYNYNRLIQYLNDGNQISYVGYYVGQVTREKSSKKSELLYEGQQRFLSLLKKNIPNLHLILGKVMGVDKDGQKVFYEKGVDVRIAIDMVQHAFQNKFDEAMLLSSDSDLLPAVKVLQEYKKTVSYIGFRKQKSLALLAESDSSRILTIDECKQFEYR